MLSDKMVSVLFVVLFLIYDNAPLGHLSICAIIFSVDSFSGFIHGRSLGLNTVGNPVAFLQQIVEWMQTVGCQIIVISSVVYFLDVESLICIFL